MATLRSLGVTDVGRSRRYNEDAFLRDDELGLYVVADGLGGHAAGEVASNEAIEVIHTWVRRDRQVIKTLAAAPDFVGAQLEARRVIERAVMAATYHVFAIAEYDAGKAGMGTTVSALIIAGAVCVTAQVGDSRVYRVRSGATQQLTEDHTLVAMQLRDGLITPEEATRVPHRNMITRAVGSHDYVEVDTAAHPVEPDDAFLLCTDGLHGYFSPAEIAAHLADPPDVAAPRMIALANQRGGKDNITAIVVRVGA